MVEQKVTISRCAGRRQSRAFKWGVLDRLLEEERLSFEGITASSAGSVNAAVLAHGLAVGGRDEARRRLQRFWKRMSRQAPRGVLQPSLPDRIPHFFNPLNHNPVRNVLEEIVDFKTLRQKSVVKLFLCATNVRTGKAKVFKAEEINVDHVLASTCLPLLMRPVEIDGEVYWDGGFSANL
jgi:NTE family protein